MIRLILIKITLCSLLIFGTSGAMASDTTSETKEEIFSAIEEYIMANPSIILRALKKLEDDQLEMKQSKEKQTIIENKDLIFSYNDIFLNPNENLVIVSFVDFNCTFCKKSDLVIRDLLKSNSDIIYLVKDFPILGELSLLAARASVSVMLHEVKNVHSEFVRNLMGIESEITMEKIRAIGLKSGVKSADVFEYMYANEVDKIINSNFEIGRKLGLEGTPSFLINNKVYRGHIDSDNLKEIINTYRRQLSGN